MTTILWTIPAITTSLGIWQLTRLKSKLILIEESTLSETKPPINYTDGLPEWTKVILKGKFGKESYFVGPRPRNDGVRGGRNCGFVVVSPFEIEDLDDKSKNGQRILVNRGWLEDKRRDYFDSETTERRTIQGVMRAGEEEQMFQAKGSDQYFHLDVPKMSQISKTQPILVEMSREGNLQREEEPVTRSLSQVFKNQHLEYAVTWFGLTLASSILIIKGRGRLVRPL